MIRSLAVALTLAVAAGAGVAQDSKTPFAGLSGDSDKPIHITAETQTADFEAETVSYSGDVRIQQGEMTLRADSVVAEAPDATLTRITASGDVIITSRDATARAPKGVYEIAGRTIRLSGGVVLTQGENTLRGSDLVVDLKAGTATLTNSGGRVEGVLQPGGTRSQ